MSEAPERSSHGNRVEEQAAHWLVQHDRGLTPKQQDEFLQWLAADSAHRESFKRHRELWADFDRLSQWRPEHSGEPNPDLLALPRRRRVASIWVGVSLLAACVTMVIVGWPWSGINRAAAPVSLEARAYQQETLSDGSVVDLNAGAHLVVHYTAAERRVVLVQGEAQFTVAKNARRPFVVRAGGVDVRAIGTAFNVKLAGPNVEVLVTEGKVHVAEQTAAVVGMANASGSSASAPAPAPVLAELVAGHRTVIPLVRQATPPAVVVAAPAEIAQILEWKPRLFDFDSVPLADVVAAFNQRNVTRLIVGDESLASLPIVASIRSDNVDGLVRWLEASVGVRAERRSGNEIVLRRAP